MPLLPEYGKEIFLEAWPIIREDINYVKLLDLPPNVSMEAYLAGKDDSYLHDESIKCEKLPWPVSCFEYSVVLDKSRKYHANIIVSASAYHIDDPMMDFFTDQSIYPDTRQISLYTCHMKDNIGFGLVGMMISQVDEHGQCLHATSICGASNELHPLVSTLFQAENNEGLRFVAMLMYPVRQAITLLHCRGIKLQNNPVPDKVKKKRIKQGKDPGVDFKTLVLDLTDPIIRKVYKGSGSGSSTNTLPIHVCRGTVRDYREKGLFGKHHILVWVPAHTRGNPEKGEIKKDYTIRTKKT